MISKASIKNKIKIERNLETRSPHLTNFMKNQEYFNTPITKANLFVSLSASHPILSNYNTSITTAILNPKIKLEDNKVQKKKKNSLQEESFSADRCQCI